MTSTEITTTPEKLVEIADRIRARTAQAVIETGRDLLKAKKLFAHGGFGAWLQSQVGIEPKMAQRYMQVARLADSLPKDKNDKLSFLPTSALYDLSAKSTSEPAREAVFEALEAGQRLNIKQVEYYLRRGERQAIEDKTDVHATAVEEPTAEVSIETALAEFGGTATSREHGLARVHKYEATTYRITTDGYRAARVECPDWPEGSDAAWADETGLEHHQVLALSSLWDAGRLMDASITSWAEAESIPPPRTKKPRKPTKAQLERQEQEAEWLFVLAELDPDTNWLRDIEGSNLDTEENRQRLEQIKAAAVGDQPGLPWNRKS